MSKVWKSSWFITFFHEEQIEVALVVLLELFGGEFVLVTLFADSA